MDRYENWNRRRERAMREDRDEGEWRDERRGQMQGERYRDYGEPQYGAYGQSSRWSPPWSEGRFSGRRFGGSEEGGRGGDYYGGRPPYEEDYGYESRGRDMPQDWSRDRWERGMEERRGGPRGMMGRMGDMVGRMRERMGGYDEGRSRWELDEGRYESEGEWSPYRGGGMGMRGRGGMGMRERRSYRGMGPKDYERSDQRIREDVCDLLTDDENIDARDITVKVERGEVILEGSVTSRHAKHMAENLADACSGVKEVHNRLRVRRMEREEHEGERTNGRQYYQGAAGQQQTSR